MPPQGPNKEKGPQVLTDRIRADELRLIDGEDNRLVSRKEAEQLAEETGLDLVIVSLTSSPPVVRLVDFGRYKFEAEKKAREAKKKQHIIDVKEIKMSVRIDDHDYEVKVRRAKQFLDEGDKVKLTIRLRGRETQHANLAIDLAKKFVVDLQDCGTPEGNIRAEGRSFGVQIAPATKPQAKKAAPKTAATQTPANSVQKAPPELSSDSKDPDHHAEDENP